VTQRLLAEPYRFEFFQTLRLLERWHGRTSGASRHELLTERVRFRNSLALTFPPSEIESLRVAPQNAGDAMPPTATPPDVEIVPAFFGLLGVGGALPLFYTELFAQREAHHKDRAARAFLDVFQQRASALLYEAWRKHRLPLHYEDDRRRHFLPALLSLTGLQASSQSPARSQRRLVHDEAVAYFAGGLQQRTRSAVQVRRIVAAHFGVPVQIEQFVGRWHELPSQACTRLGQGGGVLGQSALVGARVWQRDLRLRLTLGPLDAERFDAFLPRGRSAAALRELLTLLCGITLEHEVRLLLKPEAAPQITLGKGRARLGWDSWIHTRPPQRTLDDARYDIHAAA
jgi:type VI secretion system protein ImpH